MNVYYNYSLVYRVIGLKELGLMPSANFKPAWEVHLRMQRVQPWENYCSSLNFPVDFWDIDMALIRTQEEEYLKWYYMSLQAKDSFKIDLHLFF